MRPAVPNRLVLAWFDGWCRRALRRHFAHVHLYLDDPADWRTFDAGVSRLYVANHSSFWDGVVLYHLVRRHRPQPLFCMIDAVQVAEHPFFRRVGGFSIDRACPRDAAAAVRHAADLLGGGPNAVLVFPQGMIRPNDARPLGLEPGVAHLVERVPGVRVVPVALRYEFWGEQRGEALIHLGRERTFAHGLRREILATLDRDLTHGLNVLTQAGREQRRGDVVLLEGRRSISEWKAVWNRGGSS